MKNTTRETKNKSSFFKKHFSSLTVILLMGVYSIYFGYLTILRYKTLYASYFDLGIMHQTVFNTYKALTTGDMSRFLELTDPHGGVEQIKRMAIHNDIFLALLSPFYMIHSGPETILLLQTIFLALGAGAVYLIALFLFKDNKWKSLIGLVFAFAYLMNPALQKANLFDFHAVTFATPFILYAFYFWLTKKYGWSLFLIILSILTKEQVGLTTAFFGIYTYFKTDKKNKRGRVFSVMVFAISAVWFVLSVAVITPLFRKAGHFALKYYSEYGDSPVKVMLGLITRPLTLIKDVFDKETFVYLLHIGGPLLFLSFLSPAILIALPELGINIISKSDNMRNIYYHYTAVITPLLFISALYGASYVIKYMESRTSKRNAVLFTIIPVLIATLVFSYFKGPLPYAKERHVHPFRYPSLESENVALWAKTLQSENWKVMTTGQLAPFFTSRRYFYPMGADYDKADFILLRTNEVLNYPEKKVLTPVYEKLIRDPNYTQIFKADKLEVYRKVPYNE